MGGFTILIYKTILPLLFILPVTENVNLEFFLHDREMKSAHNATHTETFVNQMKQMKRTLQNWLQICSVFTITVRNSNSSKRDNGKYYRKPLTVNNKNTLKEASHTESFQCFFLGINTDKCTILNTQNVLSKTDMVKAEVFT